MLTHEAIAVAAFYLYEQRMHGDNLNFGYDKQKADADWYAAQSALLQAQPVKRVKVA